MKFITKPHPIVFAEICIGMKERNYKHKEIGIKFDANSVQLMVDWRGCNTSSLYEMFIQSDSLAAPVSKSIAHDLEGVL